MTKEEVFRSLKIENCLDSVGVDWENSEVSRPASLHFLDPTFLQAACDQVLGDRAIAAALAASALRLAKNPAAIRLLWHQHWLVVRQYEKYWRTCYQFPELDVLGADARPYYLLLAFSGLQYFGDVHKKLGIPADALSLAKLDFKASIEGAREKTGQFGLAPHYSGWWQGLFGGRLYRLGRLTFLHETYEVPARIFEHLTTKEICLLASAGMRFSEEGLVRYAAGGGWTSELREEQGSVVGNPVLPEGYAQKATKTLRRQEWREIVQAHEPVLGVHISAGSPMDIAECENSFAEALAFHARYFPSRGFRLFVCESWLMDPSLAKFARPESNIVQFQKRYFLTPSIRDLEFVSVRSIFGPEALQSGWEKVPHKTSLQRGAAEFKRGGGVFRNTWGVFPWRQWGLPTH